MFLIYSHAQPLAGSAKYRDAFATMIGACQICDNWIEMRVIIKCNLNIKSKIVLK